MKPILLLSLLAPVIASPAPQPVLPSIFQDKSIPVADNLDLSVFNITPAAKKPHSRDVDKRALTFNYILCNVIFDGRNLGNQEAFRVAGQLLVTAGIPSSGTRKGANPVDVAISIGNPSSNPRAGSIRYVTNRYLYPYIGAGRDTSRLDFAFVTSTATRVGVTVDTTVAASNPNSVYNTRTNPIWADVYNPATGGFNVVFANNGAVSGSVNLVGRGVISGGRGSYKALISGSVVQRGTTTL